MTDREWILSQEERLKDMPIDGTAFSDHLDNMKWASFCLDLLRKIKDRKHLEI